MITIECRKTNFYLNFENLSAATEDLFRKNARNYRFKTCLTPVVMYEWCTLCGVNGVLYHYIGAMCGVLYILTRYGG